MKLLVISSYLSVLLAVVPTCGKREVPCDDEAFRLATVGYTFEEMTPVLVRWYDHGTSFTNPVDSFQYYFRPPRYGNLGDTLQLNNFIYETQPTSPRPFFWRHDYEVYFPAVDKTYRIYSLRNEGHLNGEKAVDVHSAPCWNRLTSYEMDGIVHQFKEGPVIYLVK